MRLVIIRFIYVGGHIGCKSRNLEIEKYKRTKELFYTLKSIFIFVA